MVLECMLGRIPGDLSNVSHMHRSHGTTLYNHLTASRESFKLPGHTQLSTITDLETEIAPRQNIRLIGPATFQIT